MGRTRGHEWGRINGLYSYVNMILGAKHWSLRYLVANSHFCTCLLTVCLPMLPVGCSVKRLRLCEGIIGRDSGNALQPTSATTGDQHL